MSFLTASDALPYPQRLEATLRAQLLPNVINLGAYYRDSWHRQEGFVRMTPNQFLQLAHQLQAQCHVTHLNLAGNCERPETLNEMLSGIIRQRGLQELNLSRTCFDDFC